MNRHAKNFSAIYSAVYAWGYYKRLMAQYNVISAYFSHKSRLERGKETCDSIDGDDHNDDDDVSDKNRKRKKI